MQANTTIISCASITLDRRRRYKRGRWTALLSILAFFLVISLPSLPFLPTSDGQSVLPYGIPADYVIGWIGPLNTPNSASLVYGHAGLIGFQLGMRYINSHPEMLPGVTLHSIINDTRSDLGLISLLTNSQITSKGAIALVGEYQTASVLQVQYVARYFRVPHCTPAASTMEFTTNHVMYPTFFRVVPNIGIEAALLVPLLLQFDYRNIALVYTTDTTGLPAAKVLTDAAKRANMTILESTSFESGSTKFSFQMDILTRSNARIFVFVGTRGDFAPFLRAAAKAGLVGEGYGWFSTHHIGSPSWFINATGERQDDLVEFTQGFIATQYPTDAASQVYQDFEKMFRNLTVDPIASSIDPQDLSQPIPTYALTTFDCTLQLAAGLRSTIYEQGLDPSLPANRPALMQAMLSSHAQGTTGQIDLTPEGDRPLALDIVNYQGLTKGWVQIGRISRDGVVTLTEDPQWPGTEPEGGSKPVDVLPEPEVVRHFFNDGVVIGVITLCALGLVVSFICLLIVLSNWTHVVMKSASPPFLVCLIIGVFMLCASMIPRALVNSTFAPTGTDNEAVNLCVMELFLTNLGYTALVTSLLIKCYRLHRIFHRKNLARVVGARWKDRTLGLCWLGGLALQSAQLLALILSVPIQRVHTIREDRDHLVCDVSDSSSYSLNRLYLPTILSTRFGLLLVTTLAAFACRKIGKGFSESSQLLYCMYNMSFLSILLPAIEQASGRGEDGPLIAYCVSVFLICTLTLIIMFLPKYLLILKKRNELPQQEPSAGITMEQERAMQAAAQAALERAHAMKDKENHSEDSNSLSTHSNNPSPRAYHNHKNGTDGQDALRSRSDSRSKSRSAPPQLIIPAKPTHADVMKRMDTPLSGVDSSASPVSPVPCAGATSTTLTMGDRGASFSSTSPTPTSPPLSSASERSYSLASSLTPSHLSLLVDMFRGYIEEKDIQQTVRRHASMASSTATVTAPSSAVVTSAVPAPASASSRRLIPRPMSREFNRVELQQVRLELPSGGPSTLSSTSSSPAPVTSAGTSGSDSSSPPSPTPSAARPAMTITAPDGPSNKQPESSLSSPQEIPSPSNPQHLSLTPSHSPYDSPGASPSPRSGTSGASRRVLRYHLAPGSSFVQHLNPRRSISRSLDIPNTQLLAITQLTTNETRPLTPAAGQTRQL